jgi:hypothetical protein
MSQELIGKDKFKKLETLISDLNELKDELSTAFKLPVIIVDENNFIHKITDVKIEWDGQSIPGAKFVEIKVGNIRIVRESKVEIALNRSEGDLTKHQEAIRRAVKCSDAEAKEILEELNVQDFLLLSGDDWRAFAKAFDKKDADMKTLQEAYREKCEISEG